MLARQALSLTAPIYRADSSLVMPSVDATAGRRACRWSRYPYVLCNPPQWFGLQKTSIEVTKATAAAVSRGPPVRNNKLPMAVCRLDRGVSDWNLRAHPIRIFRR
jgi:hypothetical protein